MQKNDVLKTLFSMRLVFAYYMFFSSERKCEKMLTFIFLLEDAIVPKIRYFFWLFFMWVKRRYFCEKNDVLRSKGGRNPALSGLKIIC